MELGRAAAQNRRNGIDDARSGDCVVSQEGPAGSCFDAAAFFSGAGDSPRRKHVRLIVAARGRRLVGNAAGFSSDDNPPNLPHVRRCVPYTGARGIRIAAVCTSAQRDRYYRAFVPRESAALTDCLMSEQSGSCSADSKTGLAINFFYYVFRLFEGKIGHYFCFFG